LARAVLSSRCMRALTLGSCLAVAVTLAFTGNLLLEAALRVPPEATLRAPRGEDERQLMLDRERLARTFGTPLRPRPGPAPTRPLPLKLLGTLDDHAAAMADASTGQCRTLRIGDRWNDVELIGVGHGRVTVRRDGTLEEVAMGGVTSAAILPVASAALAISFTPRGASLAMQRSELERQLPLLTQRAMDGGRIVPAFEGGKLSGFRLLSVRADSLYAELGLRSGDVLETVNGASLSSPAVAVGLVTSLRDQRQISVVVNRGGERLTWDLSLN
jgi:general secretion pathway protein C